MTKVTTTTSVAQRLFFVSAAASVASVGILVSAAPVQAADANSQVWVCQYDRTPDGVTPRAGTNPIQIDGRSVDQNNDGQINVGDQFAEAQVVSVIVQVGGENPGAGICSQPVLQNIATATPEVTPPTRRPSASPSPRRSSSPPPQPSPTIPPSTPPADVTTAPPTTPPTDATTTTPPTSPATAGTATTPPTDGKTPGAAAPQTGGSRDAAPVRMLAAGVLFVAAALLAVEAQRRRRAATRR
jgi:hypothetical protein